MKLLNPEGSKDPIEALNLFIETVEATEEWDYGDCMRIWNHGLLYLKDHFRETANWAHQKLDEMQFYVQFEPNWDVPSTKARILKDSQEICEHLKLDKNSGRAA